MDTQKKVGVGLKYPIQLGIGGRPDLVTGASLIKQSIGLILDISSPSFFLGELKSKISLLLFEQNDKILLSLLRLFITDALAEWEKRIKLLDLSFQSDNEKVNCYITFRVLGEIKSDTFVYPFYKNLKN